jgi:hypothetical protein
MAFSLALQRVHLAREKRMSKAILYHLNRATAALRQRLLSGMDVISDEVILTIASMIVVAVRTRFLRRCNPLNPAP